MLFTDLILSILKISFSTVHIEHFVVLEKLNLIVLLIQFAIVLQAAVFATGLYEKWHLHVDTYEIMS